jgi:hypothetical protein
MRDQPMVIWCILKITLLKLAVQSKQTLWHQLQDMLLLRTSHVPITQIIIGCIILNMNVSLFLK